MDFIEELLRSQLVAAIGQALTPADFAVYMRHHAHKLWEARAAERQARELIAHGVHSLEPAPAE